MVDAGFTPGRVPTDYSHGDDFAEQFTISGLTIGDTAIFVVRSALGDGATTLLNLNTTNGKAVMNSSAGTVMVTETKANMIAAMPNYGRFPYWLQINDSSGLMKTIVSGYVRVLEAHQS